MAIVLKQLDQVAVTGSAVAIAGVVPGAGEEIGITRIECVNYSVANRWIKFYLDDDGTTYDNTTIIRPEITVPAGQFYKVFSDNEKPWFLNNTAGNLAVQAEAISAFTVTIFGFVRT